MNTLATVGQFVLSTALSLWSALLVSSAWVWSVLVVSSAWLWSAVLPASPAFWSAVAASFSAISSFLILLVHRRNRFDAARPELVLTGWGRATRGTGDAAHDIITIQSVRNVGRGPALNIVINCSHRHENRPTVGMSTTRVPILAATEAHDLAAELLIWWKNVPRAGDSSQHVFLTISLSSTDYINLRHETEYTLLAVPLSPAQGVADPIAPGVMFHSRRTKTTSLRRLRLRNRGERFIARMTSRLKRAAR